MNQKNENFSVPEFEDDAEPAQKPQKGQGKKKAEHEKYEPKASVNKKKEEVQSIKPVKTELEPGFHKQVGFVSESRILFPVGWKFRGGHISSKGNVVLNHCPECKHAQYPSQAVKGFCEVVNEKKGCGFSMIAELEAFEL